MNLIRSLTAFFVIVCLSIGMLTVTTIHSSAYNTQDVFSILLESLEVSEDTYDNYETVYSESIPINYSVAESSLYLALGGGTAMGVGAEGSSNGIFKNCYADKFAAYLGLSNKYINSAENTLNASDAAEYIASIEDISIADIITFQIDSSSIITACIKNGESTNLQLNWSEYITNPEFTDALQNIKSEYNEDEALVLELCLYESIVYCTKTIAAVNQIRELNPNATVLIIGLYNPVRELELETGDKTVGIDTFFDIAIDLCDVYLLDKTKEMPNVAFVDVSAAPTTGFEGVTLNLNGDPWDNLSAILNNNDGQYANADGHDYILEQLKAATNHHGTHELDTGVVNKKPECASEGEKIYTCLYPDCDYTVTEKIAPTGHKAENYTYNHDATCQNAGTLSAVCTECGEEFSVENPLGALEHTFGSNGLCIYCKTPSSARRAIVIVAIALGALAVLGGGVFGAWFYKKKMVENKENTDEIIDSDVDEGKIDEIVSEENDASDTEESDNA